MEMKCPLCGSKNLEPGNLESSGRIYFRPENCKFLSLKTANVKLKAKVCVDCGYVIVLADTEKLQSLGLKD